MPQRPKHIDTLISKHIRRKVPYFFINAKDRELKNVEPITNSTVNRLDYIIPDKRIYFKKVAGEFDHKILMRNGRARTNEAIIDKYTELDRSKRWRIKYDKSIKGNNKELYVDRYNRDEILKVNNDAVRVVDVISDHLYRINNSRSKSTLWNSFGAEIVENIRDNIDNKTILCEECEDRVWTDSLNRKYCDGCANKIDRNKAKSRMKTQRE